MDPNGLKRKIEDNDYEGVANLIDRIEGHVKLNEYLHLSLTLQRREIFDYLIEKSHSNLNIPNENNETFLHQSLKCTDVYFLTKLLKTGRINIDLDVYNTILHKVVVLDKPKFVECFLKYGHVPDNDKDSDITPLDLAIENNNMEIVSMFLYYNIGTTARHGHISPFMYSMLCNSTREIQLLLLDYEVDINSTYLSRNNLFVAIKRCKYLIRGILERGADVNQVCNNRNVIEFILDHPVDLDLFKLIWDKFDYNLWESNKRSVIMDILTERSLTDRLWLDYLRVVIESSKLSDVLNAKSPRLISIFVEECVKRNFNESDYYDLICILLTNSCPVYATDLHKVYNILGAKSQILRLLIHMDIETTNVKFLDINFIKVRYSCINKIDEMLRNFFINMRIFDMTASYKDILRYFAIPARTGDYLRDPVPAKLPFVAYGRVVPTLVELARNRSRDVICEKYNVRNGGMYYSIVNHMTLPRVVKDILTFEKPLYYVP